MTVTVELRIMQLLCSRLCHDLAGLVGAVNNGIELIEDMGGDPDAEAMGLIAASARELGRRLRYHRVAFGLTPGTANSAGEVHDLAKGLLNGGKIALDWTLSEAEAGLRFTDPATKLLLNLILLGVEALPRGGAVAVRLEAADGGLRATVGAHGRGAQVSEPVRMAFDPKVPVADLTARNVQGYFTGRLAEQAGAELRLENSDSGSVTFEALIPAA